MSDAVVAFPRGIRSFVRREGRMTDAQRQALVELWPRYGLELPPGRFDFDTAFGRRAPRILEIGFGNGDALIAAASAQPECDFVGIEVHRPGVGRLFARLAQANVDNVRVVVADASEVLTRHTPPAALTEVLIFFPDPWPKKRHHKRRLIQPAFVATLARAVQIGGHLRLATDWADYAEHMLAVLGADPRWCNTSAGVAPRPVSRPLTRFEARGERLGHQVFDFAFVRVPTADDKSAPPA